MTSTELMDKVRASLHMDMPLPRSGRTSLRHRLLMQMGYDDLSYARLAEPHWDAVAILAEANRKPLYGAVYAVWASEIPNQPLELFPSGDGYSLSGVKQFCGGAGLVDRALVTVTSPVEQLVEVDLRGNARFLEADGSGWKTNSFAETNTSTVRFVSLPVSKDCLIGGAGFYVDRIGFWDGACGPAACWAGGAQRLVEYAMRQTKKEPHALAHLGAMQANLWATQSYLEKAGFEIDHGTSSSLEAKILALKVRHLVEQACTDVLRRLGRALGPRPMAFDKEISRRCGELELYIRQCHAERDLENLARTIQESDVESGQDSYASVKR